MPQLGRRWWQRGLHRGAKDSDKHNSDGNRTQGKQVPAKHNSISIRTEWTVGNTDMIAVACGDHETMIMMMMM